MFLDGLVEFEFAVNDIPHQVDAAARTVGLIARLDVGRACRRTETAMDTIEHEFVIDFRTDRRQGSTWVLCGYHALPFVVEEPSRGSAGGKSRAKGNWNPGITSPPIRSSPSVMIRSFTGLS